LFLFFVKVEAALLQTQQQQHTRTSIACISMTTPSIPEIAPPRTFAGNSLLEGGAWGGGGPLVALVMQCCDTTTRIRLARCSRSLRQAANRPLAWKYMDNVHIPDSVLRCCVSFHGLLHGVLQHAPLHLEARSFDDPMQFQSIRHRVRSMDLKLGNNPSHEMIALHSFPALHTLQVRFNQNWDKEITIPATIHSLELYGVCGNSIATRQMLQSSHLTHLSIHRLLFAYTHQELVSIIHQCANLRVLELQGRDVEVIFGPTSPHRLQSLHKLIVHDCYRITMWHVRLYTSLKMIEFAHWTNRDLLLGIFEDFKHAFNMAAHEISRDPSVAPQDAFLYDGIESNQHSRLVHGLPFMSKSHPVTVHVELGYTSRGTPFPRAVFWNGGNLH
jgi:hypothetical protein